MRMRRNLPLISPTIRENFNIWSKKWSKLFFCQGLEHVAVLAFLLEPLSWLTKPSMVSCDLFWTPWVHFFYFGPPKAGTLKKPTFRFPSGNWTIPPRPSALHCLNFSYIRENCLHNYTEMTGNFCEIFAKTKCREIFSKSSKFHIFVKMEKMFFRFNPSLRWEERRKKIIFYVVLDDSQIMHITQTVAVLSWKLLQFLPLHLWNM